MAETKTPKEKFEIWKMLEFKRKAKKLLDKWQELNDKEAEFLELKFSIGYHKVKDVITNWELTKDDPMIEWFLTEEFKVGLKKLEEIKKEIEKLQEEFDFLFDDCEKFNNKYKK